MKECLVRAKRIDRNVWIEGYYCSVVPEGNRKHYIIPYYETSLYGFKIDPEIILLYTGFKDKNGTRIFEGDKIEFEDCIYYNERFLNRAIVSWNGISFGLRYFEKSGVALEEEDISSLLKNCTIIEQNIIF
jgi:hypothetical protein